MMTEKQTALRLPTHFYDRADALVPIMDRDPAVNKYGRVLRSTVLRLAIDEGLAQLEKKYGLAQNAKPALQSSAPPRPGAPVKKKRRRKGN